MRRSLMPQMFENVTLTSDVDRASVVIVCLREKENIFFMSIIISSEL